MSYATQTPLDSIERIASQSISLEQRLLGSILMHPQTWVNVRDHVQVDDFAEDIHKRVFSAAAALAEQGKVPDLFSVNAILGDIEMEKKPEGFTTTAYLARLATEAALPALAIHDAGLIHEFGRRRGLITMARELERDAADVRVDRQAAEIANDALSGLQGVVTGATDNSRREIGSSASNVLEYARAVRAHEIESQAVTTGFSDLDHATGGYEAGTLWIIGARPGAGKTVLMVSSSSKVGRAGQRALDDGHEGFGAMAFSLEVPERQITGRYLSDICYHARNPIQFGRISRGDISDQELEILDDGAARLGRLPIILDVASRVTVSEIMARVRAEKARLAKRGYRLSVVFIDYLKFIQASDRYKGQRVYEVGEISRGLKELAKQEGLCVVLLAQLNRALENRDDKRPTLSDLRESGDLEADADVVAFIHRESYHISKSADYVSGAPDAIMRFEDCKNEAELVIGKNRAGPTPIVKLWCDVGCSTMGDAVRDGYR